MQRISELTEAERRVLPYLVAGLSYRQIAADLCVSWTTVRNQGYAIRDKFIATNGTQLATIALLTGQVDATDIIELWRQYMPHLLEAK